MRGVVISYLITYHSASVLLLCLCLLLVRGRAGEGRAGVALALTHYKRPLRFMGWVPKTLITTSDLIMITPSDEGEDP